MLLVSDGNSAVQFITVLLIFLLVLGLTYFVTRWTANFQKGKMGGGNVEVIESIRITSDKYIEIVRIANRYVAIAVAKDAVTLLAELSEEEIQFRESSGPKMNFGELLEKVREKKTDA